MDLDLHTTDARAGMVKIATVFAERAKDPGVTISVKNLPTPTSANTLPAASPGKTDA